MTIQPTIRIFNDDVAIIDSLVDNNEMFKKFDIDQTTTYLVGEDLHLVFYFANSTLENKLLMYVIDNFTENQESMTLILNLLQENINCENHIYIMKMAKSKMLDMLYMTNTFRALFGKDKTQEANELHY